MIYENDNLIIEYSDADKLYIANMVKIVEENSGRILKFFNLSKLNTNCKIVIWSKVEDYIANLTKELKKGGRDYQPWMIADTCDGNINLVTLDKLRTMPNRENYTLEDQLDCIKHEFTHICHLEVLGNCFFEIKGWLFELLATNLGDPNMHRIIQIDCNLEDLEKNWDYISDNYQIVFTIGKYLFENYNKEFILEFCTNKTKYEELKKQVFEDAKQKSNQFRSNK